MKSDETGDELGADSRWLQALGVSLREARIAWGISATAAAQTAGVSRMTWHRMEAGSPSVSAGAYARALDAVGIADVEQSVATETRPAGMIPTRIRVGDWPELTALGWSLQPDTLLTPHEALAVYERNSRHLDLSKISAVELALIEDLREGLADGVHS